MAPSIQSTPLPWIDKHGIWKVTFAWRDFHGRSEPAAMLIEAPDGVPLTRTVVRAIPLGELMETDRHRIIKGAVGKSVGKSARADRSRATAQSFGAQRGVTFTTADLQRVADVYLRAYGARQPVTAAVAEAFNISRSTAAKRVMRARAAGLIPSEINAR